MNKKKIELFIVDNLIWFIDLGLIAAFTILQPRFLSFGNMISILFVVVPMGFLVLAMAVCLISGNFDLSVGAIAGFSATIAGVWYLRWMPGTPWPVLILIMLLIGAGIGFFNGFFIAKFKVNAFLQTLGSYILFYGLMLIVSGKTLFDLPKEFYAPGSHLLASFAGGKLYLATIDLIIALIAVHLLLTRTSLGRRIYAVGSNPKAARECGIDVEKTLIYVFMISGILSAIGGLHYAGYVQCVTMTMARNDLFFVFAGAVIGGVSLSGGKGKISGVFGGIILLGIIEMGLTLILLPATWREAIFGVVLISAILVNTTREKIIMHLKARD